MQIEKNSLILAPMAGVTDMVYRRLCTQMGAQATVTEMVSAKGYLLTPREREDVIQLRQTSPDERCALQIFGSDADCMGRAAERLCESRFFALDVNMGCPAPKIVSGGDGSAMLKDLKNAERVLTEVVKHSTLPVTVKMRLGWDARSVCFLEAGKMAQDCGVSAVTLHARTRQQMYAGHADWDAIGELASRLAIPVIGNGDVESVADAQRMLRQTGCHAVMVGRGAMGNPWLFRDWARAPALQYGGELGADGGHTGGISAPAGAVDYAQPNLRRNMDEGNQNAAKLYLNNGFGVKKKEKVR